MMLIGVIAVVVGLLLLLYGRSRRRRLNLPAGAIVYEDLQRRACAAKTFVSDKYGISGKPDLLIDTDAGIVPVELKHSARTPRGAYPHDSHAPNCSSTVSWSRRILAAAFPMASFATNEIKIE